MVRLMDWQVDPSLETPPWRQVVEQVLDAIASDGSAPQEGSGPVLGAGDQLPSVRGMAAAARVNHNTVARAYRDLEQLGVVRAENGRGVFVLEQGPERARALRRAETLETFGRAALEALRAGHSLEDLFDQLKRGRRFSA